MKFPEFEMKNGSSEKFQWKVYEILEMNQDGSSVFSVY